MANRLFLAFRLGASSNRIFGFCVLLAALLCALSWQRGWLDVLAQSSAAVTVSAASYEPVIAPESIASVFGPGVATTTAIGADTDPATPGIQLPTTLAGTTVEVAGRRAGLFFVSPQQINFLVPAETPVGNQPVRVTSGNGSVLNGTVTVNATAPGLFTADASGSGIPSAVILRVAANGSFSYDPIVSFDGGQDRLVRMPIRLGPEGEQVFLVMFATGLRRANDPNRDGNVNESVRMALGGEETTPMFAGAAPGLLGLDQINVLLPRTLIGRGVVTLSISAAGGTSSNVTEIEIAGPPNTNAPTLSGFGQASALAGQIVTIQGSGFSTTPSQNLVRIGDLETQVVSSSFNQINALVPFGVISAPVSVRTPTGETRSSNALGIRTSVSGIVTTTGQQPLSDVSLQLISLATGQRVTTRTGSNGAFVAADVPTGGLFLRVQGASVPATPALETITLPVSALGNRDNPYQQTIFLQPVSGASAQVGGSSGFAGSSEEPTELSIPIFAEQNLAEPDQTSTRLQIGNAIFELPANVAARFPDGATRGVVTLTQVMGSRVPARFPAGVFSSSVVQISPFGVTFNPGGKLTFPNADGFTAGAALRLYRFDQNENSPTLGQFVVVGEARVSGDGQRVETNAGAITGGGYYFVSLPGPTTTVTGRVLDADGTPVRRALVRVRGQDALTDGNGGFIIRNVPARSATDALAVEAEFLRPTGRVDRTTRGGIAPVVNGLTGIRPELRLPSANSNQPPIIFAPEAVSVPSGETSIIPILAGDPDSDQAITFTVTGAAFASLSKGDASPRSYNLRLAPATVGETTLTLRATDAAGAQTTHTMRVVVVQGNRAPVAHNNSATTDEDTPRQIIITATDPDGDKLTYTIVTPPTKGTLSGTAPNNLIYTPNKDVFGSDSFTFKANDGKLDSNLATITLTINPVNDAPVLTVPGPQTVKEGESLSFLVSATDVENDVLSFSAPSLPPGANFINAERRFFWVPGFDRAGKYTVTIAVFDNGSPPKSDVKSVEITVTNVNRPPTANAQDLALDEDTPRQFTLTGNDPDNDALTYMLVTAPAKGTLSGNAPNLTYTPNKDFNGSDSFTFKVSDGTAESAPATVRLTIKPVNDAPVAVGQSVTLDEDTVKEITVTASDVDGDRLTYSLVTQPTKGKVTGAGPLFTYTPNRDANGPDSFSFKANDGTADSNVATVTLTINPINDAPTARDKRVTTNEDFIVGVGLDVADAEGDPLTFNIITQPKNGKLSGIAPNLLYTPDPNFNGTDAFTYNANDGKLTSNTATMTIVVTPVNDMPTVAGLNLALDEDTPLAIKLIAHDIDGDALQYIIVTPPTLGKLSGIAPNLTYTPNTNANGTDMFAFKVNDGTVDSTTAFVQLTIRPVNDPPRVRPQTVETIENKPVNFTLDVADPDGDKLTYTIVTPPTKGALTGTPPTLTFTPTKDLSGEDSFTYRVSDGTVTTEPVTVTIQIGFINDPPVLIVPGPQTVAEGQTLSFTISAIDDSDPKKRKFNAPKLPPGANFLESQQLFTWTPNFEQAGTYVAAFNVEDNDVPPYNSYKEVTITVTNTNRAPRANTLTVNATEDTPVNFTLTGADDDRDPITFMVVTPPRFGRLSGNAPNLTYTPDLNFNGTDTLTFKASDGNLDSAFAVVTFNVAAVNDPPVLRVPDAQFLNEGQRLAFTLTFSDPDTGQTHTFSATNLPPGAQLNAQTGAFEWRPGNKQAGTYTITFRVTDNGAPQLSDSQPVTITVTNPAPIARNMAIILDEDTPRQFVLDASDADGDTLTYIVINAPQHGTLSGTAPNLTYTPALNFNGADQFTFKVNDGVADSNVATVSLTINSVNDAPTLMVPDPLTGDEGKLLSFTISASDPDVGQTITLSATNLPEGAQFNRQTGEFTWTPSFTQAGRYTVNFTATDNGTPVRSDSKAVTITIRNVNRAPVANPASVTVDEDTPKAIVLTGSDPDGDALTFTILTPPRNGLLTGTAPNLTYTPNANFNGMDSFTFRVKDATLESAFATIDLVVTPVNDPPVLTVPGAQMVNENQLLSFTVSATDLDGPTPLVFSASNLPRGATFNAATRTFTWTPDYTQAGDYTVNFAVADSANPPLSDTKSVAIKVVNVNLPPLADAKNVTTDEEVAVTITLTGSDPDGQTISFAIVNQPAHGTLSGTAPNVTYTPKKDYFGTDTFTYRTSDGSLTSAPATVTITIRNVNDAPVANAQSIAVDEDTPKSIVLTGTDADGDTLTFMITAAPTHGRLSGTPPNMTYMPNQDYNGPDSFSFKVNDGKVDSNIATIALTVGGVNDPPRANAQQVVTDEDTPKPITLTGSDPENDPLTFMIVTPPTNGTLTGTLPNVTYSPNANFNGSDSFTFKVNDGMLDSPPATVAITINPVNDKPVITVPGAQTVNEGAVLTFSVSAQDVDQGQTLTLSASNLPVDSTFNPQTGAFSWRPGFDQAGTYTVTFTATDNGTPPQSDSKTVTITVVNVERAPIANAQLVTTDEDMTKAITLTGSDPEGGTLTFVIVTQPMHGTLSGTAPNVTYAPAANYNGADSFTFKVTSGGRESTPATVNITVIAINDAPTITAPDARTLNEGENVNFVVSANDVDAGQTITLSSSTLPNGATFNVNTGAFNWTPNFQQNGVYQITFTATDNGTPQRSASKTVTITVNDVNQAPTALSRGITTAEDTPVAITLTGTDPENDPLTFVVVSLPSNGTLSGTAPNLTYTPNLNFNGQDSFAFKTNDGKLDSVNGLISITVTPVNDPPALTVPGPLTVAVNQLVTFQVSATDPDAGQTLTFSASNLPSGATFDAASRTFNWTPTAITQTPVIVTFTVSDGSLSDSKTVAITVSAITGNRPPVCVPQNVTTNEDTPITITLVCTDPDNDPITISVVQNPLNGVLSSVTGANVTYSPKANFNGSDNFSFRANDGKVNGETATVSINVTAVCDAPVITVPGAQSVAQGQQLQFIVTATDEDVPSTLTLSARNLPDGATFTPGTNSGQFSWTPGAFFPTGVVTVDFTVTDDCNPAKSDTKSVRINVGAGDAWTQTNGPEGGKITSFAVSGSTVFAGTLGGGVFRSDDRGIKWTRVNSGLTSLDITALAVTGTTIYAGTAGEGVFRSTNNGATWTEYNKALTQGFVYVLTANATHLYAVVADTAFSDPLIRRTLHDGSGWVNYNRNFPARVVTSDLQLLGGNIYASTLSDGVLVSSATTDDWREFNTGFPRPPASLTGKSNPARRLPLTTAAQRLNARKLATTLQSALRTSSPFDDRSLAVIDLRINALAASGSTLYAATDDGVWATVVSPTTGNADWKKQSGGIDAGAGVNAIEVVGANLFARSELSDFVNGAFVTSYKLIKSAVATTLAWSPANTGAANQAINAFIGNADFVLAGSEGSGIYRSTNAGASWLVSNSGLNAAIVSSLHVNGTSLLAGTEGAGIFVSTDEGQTWASLNNGLNALFPLSVTSFAQSNTTLYAGTCGRGVYRSTDNGATWTAFNSGEVTGACVQDLLANDSTVYAAAGNLGLYVTPVASLSWNRVNAIPDGIDATALLRTSGNLFLGTGTGSLYRANAEGTGWAQVGVGMPNDGSPVSSLVQLQRSGPPALTYLFVGRNNDGVYRSSDNGTNFTQESNGMTQRTVTALRRINTTVYAATNGGGVFYTNDDGENWSQIINNLTNLRSRSLVIKDGKLFVGTEGGGVFFRPMRE